MKHVNLALMTGATMNRATAQLAPLDRTGRAIRYAVYGVQVLSEVPLPVVPLQDVDSDEAAWIIRCRPPTADLPIPSCPPLDDHRMPDGTPVDRFYRSQGDAWLWDRQAGLYHLEPARGRVTVTPLPDADPDDLGLLVIGPIAAFLLQQAGYPTLHASAVVTEHGACAFMAPSTAGKSTLAAGLLRAGARLLSDDLLPLEIRPDGVYGLPGAPMMKLWQSTVRGTLGITQELPHLSTLTEKRLLTFEQHAYPFHGEVANLRAIYLPRRYDPQRDGTTTVRIEPLSPREAVLALLSQTFRGHYLYPHELAALLKQYERLVLQTRVALLHLPTGFEHRDAVTARVLADLAAP
jgi:hypothetical protein